MHIPQTIEQFLHFISGTNKKGVYFNYCFLDKDSKEQIKGYGVKYGTAQTILAELELLRGIHPTLHVTLNIGKPSGRTTNDMVASRVLCVDLDTDTPDEAIKEIVHGYAPHLIVKSSRNPNKYHIYWRITGVSLELWSKFQLALAYKFEGDLAMDTIAKTIRVPGVERILKTGERYIPEIVYVDEDREKLSVEDIYKLFPEMNTLISLAAEYKKKVRRETKKQVKESLKSGSSITPGEGRNTTLWNEVYKYILQIDGITSDTLKDYEQQVKEFAIDLNSKFSIEAGGALDDREFNTVLESAFKTAKDKLDEKEEDIECSEDEHFDELTDDTDLLVPVTTQSSTPQPQVKGKKDKKKQVKGKNANIANDVIKLVEALKDIPTNGVSGNFEYDYNKGALVDSRFSTLGVVERVFQRYGNHLINKNGVLYAYNYFTCTWERQTPADCRIITSFVVTCCRDILRDPAFITEFCTGDNPKKKLRIASEKFLSGSFISSARTAVWQDSRVTTKTDADFDRVPYLFYANNGVVDLRNGQIRQPEAKDLLLRKSNIDYVPGAECPKWLEFLAEIFEENEQPQELINFMQVLFGYSLSGLIDAQKVFIHYGSGSNGKSKVMDALKLLLGSYSTIMAGEVLAKNEKVLSKEMERITVKIETKRVAIIDDLDSKTQWNEGLIKNLTGSELTSRRLYEEESTICNRAKFHMGCNDRPSPQSENFGILRRLCIIPYLRQFEPDPHKESEIREMLKNEAAGILNWAIKGYQKYAESGLMEPDECKWTLQEYKVEHFVQESIFSNLFKLPSKGSKTAKWYSTQELVEYVNESFNKQGMAYKKVSMDKLGAWLKNGLKAEKKRTQVEGVRRYFYLVELVDKEQQEEKSLLEVLN